MAAVGHNLDAMASFRRSDHRGLLLASTPFLAAAAIGVAWATATACSFGVNLDGIFSSDGAVADGPAPEASIPIVDAVQVRSGDGFSCARRADGTVSCWGYNGSSGRLGDGTRDSRSTPVLVKDIADAVDLSAGAAHACAVRKSGGVACWGYNDSRQLGDGTNQSSRIPVAALMVNDATQVAAGGNFTCALRKDATVWCWGDNAQGQLGDGTTTSRGQPAPVISLTDVVQITAQYDLACALVKSGEVYCWGDNSDGQAGVDTMAKDVLTPSKVASLSGVTLIESGSTSDFTCALTATDVRCWGVGSYGCLGNGAGSSSATPVVVVALNDAVHVSTGRYFGCATRKSGAVSCWGNNGWRQLGVGDVNPPDQTSSPVPVANVAGAQKVSTGGDHACALLAGGKITCWGSNVDGRLGRGTQLFSATPQKVAFNGPATGLAVGGDHACALDGQGNVSCWGTNGEAQLGTNDPAASSPVPVKTISGASSVAAGSNHSCALVSGSVKCWGYGYYGELGNGAGSSSRMPVTFGASTSTFVGGGYHRTCAIVGGGEVECAGLNSDGRLGQPGPDSDTPVRVLAVNADPDGGVANLSGVDKLAVGGSHSCALRGTELDCWGTGSSGQCGTMTHPNPIPVQATMLPTPATQICAGGGHTCAVLQDGSVACFGSNDTGQLGASGASGPKPRVPGLGGKTAKAIGCGSDHACAVLSDGTVSCWGRGDHGQLGNGVRADSPTPVVVSNLANVKALAGGGDHTCALQEDGSLWCWGDDSIGQLGVGTLVVTGTAASVVGY